MTITRAFAALVLAAILAAACGDSDADSTAADGEASQTDGQVEPGETNVLTGEISVEGAGETSELPVGARVVVQLEDVSIQDTSSTVIATQTIEGVESLPVRYELTWTEELLEDRTYSVSAEVSDGEDVLFLTDTIFDVLPGDDSLSFTIVPAS